MALQVLTNDYGNPFPNGTEWTQSNITDRFAYDIKRFKKIIVAATDGGIYYSADGKVWTLSNMIYVCINFHCANGIIVAATASKGLYYSTDGINWTQTNITSGGFNAVYNANGIWVAGSSKNLGLYYSTDGINWTQTNITSGDFYCFRNINGLFITGELYSTDGKTWEWSNVNCKFYDICDDNGDSSIIVGATSLGIYFSVDNGKTWEQSNVTIGYFKALYYHNGLWVAGGDDNYSMGLRYSLDGMEWTQSNITYGYIHAILNACGIWIGSFNYSVDGKNWSHTNLYPNILTKSIYNDNGIWILGTNGNGLYYSTSWEAA